MAYIKDKICDTAEDFIDYFRRHSGLKTDTEWRANLPGIGGFIFRGQADAEWKLIPKVFRKNN